MIKSLLYTIEGMHGDPFKLILKYKEQLIIITNLRCENPNYIDFDVTVADAGDVVSDEIRDIAKHAIKDLMIDN